MLHLSPVDAFISLHSCKKPFYYYLLIIFKGCQFIFIVNKFVSCQRIRYTIKLEDSCNRIPND
jgi:hypothetical protein